MRLGVVENQHRNYRLAVSSCAKNEASFLAPIVTLFFNTRDEQFRGGTGRSGDLRLIPWRRRLGRSGAPFRCLSSAKSLGRRSERLDLPELRQQCVLIVIAVAGNHLAFFVEMPDFAELQRHPASRGLQRTEQPAVCAFPSELSNDHIPGVNVLGVGDSGRPKRPWPNLPVRTVQIDRSGDARKAAEALRKPASHQSRIQIPSHTPAPGNSPGTLSCFLQVRFAV